MATILVLVAVYILGGLTCVPLFLLLLLSYSAVALPRKQLDRDNHARTAISPEDDDENLRAKLLGASDVEGAAGYFAVCRNYVPGGVNGKPPERTTPAGETVATESPSVYQSMYRSIFDRSKTQSPSIDAGKPVKRARNVFYVVLRHGHLLLFDNSEQLEVRHVIALPHYSVSIYGPEGEIPEGELYIKRNCIRLSRKHTSRTDDAGLAPFYLFAENCSEKEDFYHALLKSQKRVLDSPNDLPTAQEFGTEDIIKLIRQVHVSEEGSNTKWFNALIGRLFLALYKTPEIENFFQNKIRKKISRVSKPTFVTSMDLEEVDMGDSAPIFSHPRMREMNIDGTLMLEADVKYTGNFKAVVSAVARIELGQRIKAREVELVLAVILKRLEGHVLFRIKPPPSNRIWFSFEVMPKLEMAIEPIFNSRQITYGIVLRAIESRLREVIAEALVFPNWDDIPFINTTRHVYRGGVWKLEHEKDSISDTRLPEIRTSKTEPIEALSTDTPRSRQPSLSAAQSEASQDETIPNPIPSETQVEESPPPKSIRSSSFASAAVATPAIVTKIPVTREAMEKRSNSRHRDATSAMKSLSTRSQDTSPMGSPTRLHPQDSDGQQLTIDTAMSREGLFDEVAKAEAERAYASSEVHLATPDQSRKGSLTSTPGISRQSSGDSLSNSSGRRSIPRPTPPERRQTVNQTINSATAAARKWSLGVLQRQGDAEGNKISSKLPQALGTQSQPIGRGQPLPPPGVPLPGPEPKGWAAGAFNSLKRRHASSSSITLPGHIQRGEEGENTGDVLPAAPPSISTVELASSNKDSEVLPSEDLSQSPPGSPASLKEENEESEQETYESTRNGSV